MSDLNFDANFEDYVSFKANFGIVTSSAAVVDPTVTEDSPNPVASSGIYTFVKDEVSAEKTSRDAAIFAESQERMKGDEDIQRYITSKIEAEESARSSADTDLANSISELSRNSVKTVNHIAPDAEGNVNVEGGGSGLVDDVKVNGISVVTDKVANVAVPTKVSSLENDAGYITESDIPSIPTKTSDLTNDSDFITSADVPAPYDDTEIREEISGLDDKIKDLELFKFPNVTIIGTPTINNGQISDFSATSYLKFPFLVDFRSQPFEINMCFTTGSNVVQQENIFDSDYGLAFAIRNSRFVIAISTNGTSWDLGEGVGTLTVQPNTTYYIKISWNGSQYVLFYSLDGTTYTADITKSGTAQPYPKQIYIGVGENFASVVNHFGGTINLNNANLKVNGEIFWTGMDDAGISTRADVSLSNIDADGEAKIKEVAETEAIKASLASKIEDSALNPLRNDISTLTSQMASKQDKLVSGTNIKTINGNTLLGSGDISVGGGSEPVQLNIADYLSTTPARITNISDLSFDSNLNFSFVVKPTTGYENLILSLGSLNVGSEYLLEYDVTLNSEPTFSGNYAYETYVSAGIPRAEANNSYDNLPRTRGETKHYSMAFFNEISGIPMYLCFFMPIISSANISYTVSNLKLSVKEYSGASASEIDQIKADLNGLYETTNETVGIETTTVDGYLSANGTITPSDTYGELTTDFIPINEGYELGIKINYKGSYNRLWLAHCIYDSNKTIIGSRVTDINNGTGDKINFTYSSNVAKYVRFSWRINLLPDSQAYTMTSWGIYFNKIKNVIDGISDKISKIDFGKFDMLFATGQATDIKPSTWETGGIGTTGADTTSTVRIRSPYIPLSEFKKMYISVADGYRIAYHFYSSNASSAWVTGSWWLTGTNEFINGDDYVDGFVRICLAETTDKKLPTSADISIYADKKNLATNTLLHSNFVPSKSTRYIYAKGKMWEHLWNTKEAFEEAGKSEKCWGISGDVQFTSDGQLVMYHDSKVDYNGSSVNLNSLTLAQIQTINLTSDGKTYKIPTFDEFITICRKYGKFCIIESKGSSSPYPWTTNGHTEDLERIITKVYELGMQNSVAFAMPTNDLTYLQANHINLARIWLLDASINATNVKKYMFDPQFICSGYANNWVSTGLGSVVHKWDRKFFTYGTRPQTQSDIDDMINVNADAVFVFIEPN